MSRKVQWASAMALAATAFAALIGAQGSGAAASDMVPAPAEQKPAVTFVSKPVVQAVASEDGVETDGVPAEQAGTEISDAVSLAQLVTEQAMPQKLDRQMRCLAGAIYFEARGETLEGQLAVGRVIVNRAASDRFPDSYCGVVLQRSQFSFVRGRAIPAVRKHSQGWRRAVAIAQIARNGSWKSPAKGALFFHAARVSPNWHLTRVGRIDNHIFYR
ncbi:cell wall hydrolase [Novosphingobium beihaiensis]|uniref:Cell wall hydrolase n=1 Tax=Novosphingobium beihaiensis TaxID=2930389 RepID=A0ABT0BR35_9SPHN|nr:cell wall hydrolase [Novosphingobium beihaiensis]MCJ2187512.1 cell wall hydrolase [Novosphingobium beihaiensis]